MRVQGKTTPARVAVIAKRTRPVSLTRGGEEALIPSLSRDIPRGERSVPCDAQDRKGPPGAFPAFRLAWKAGNGPFPLDHEVFPAGNALRKEGMARKRFS